MSSMGNSEERQSSGRIAGRSVNLDVYPDVGTLIKHHRTLARLTQVELADLSTVSLRTIRNLESGRSQNPRLETIRLLADGLRLDPKAFETLNLALGRGLRGAALAAAVGQSPNSIQLSTSPLVGRQHELASALGIIQSGASRVITLSGFGGAGKSRLAISIARAASQKYSMPWLWVSPPAPLDTHVVSGASSGVTWIEGTPTDRYMQWVHKFTAGAESAVDELASLIGGSRFLLIFDDVARFGAALNTTSANLLQRCGGLVILETTRQVLGRTKKQLMPLKPLNIEGAAAGGAGHGNVMSAALELLLSLVRTADPEFQSTQAHLESLSKICYALDGLPRAIENAASWLAVSRPSQVADMAMADPFAVGCDRTPDAGRDQWAYEALADAIEGLPPSQYSRLERFSLAPDPWTLEEAAAFEQEPPTEVGQSIHEFLAAGLIRPAGALGGKLESFTVLNHVRSFLR